MKYSTEKAIHRRPVTTRETLSNPSTHRKLTLKTQPNYLKQIHTLKKQTTQPKLKPPKQLPL